MSARLSPTLSPLRVVVSGETDESEHLVDVVAAGHAVRYVTNAASTVVGAMRVQIP